MENGKIISVIEIKVDVSFYDICCRIEMKVVKGKSREPRECFMLEDGRHILPKGIFFIKRIQGKRSVL